MDKVNELWQDFISNGRDWNWNRVQVFQHDMTVALSELQSIKGFEDHTVEFLEKEFRGEYSRRSIGMAPFQNEILGARHYHDWVVKPLLVKLRVLLSPYLSAKSYTSFEFTDKWGSDKNDPEVGNFVLKDDDKCDLDNLMIASGYRARQAARLLTKRKT